MAKNAVIVSLGCVKNLVDSENILALLDQENFKIIKNFELAEIIIINTCGFIGDAKEESINTILEMAEYKKNGACQALIVVGCLVQRYSKELWQEIPEIDGFLGTDNYHQIVEIIDEIFNLRKRVFRINKQITEKYLELPRYITPRHYAYLRIAEGCDNHCTYCAIPEIRGRYRSRSVEAILTEAKELISRGAEEIILIAQDTTQYGQDLYGEIKLPYLIKQLAALEGLRWIRLLYLYPNSFTDELIETIAGEPKVCKYIDLPLQHADDTILRKMGRNITNEKIRELIKKLRNQIPEIIIRSTFIVGFPGETADNFNKLLEFLKELRLDRVGAFTYSQEEGTPAGEMKEQISDNLKEKRLSKLMELQYQILQEKHAALRGKVIKVQVEKPSIDQENLWICRSEGEAPDIDPVILVQTNEQLCPGKLIEVQITHLADYDLIGEIKR